MQFLHQQKSLKKFFFGNGEMGVSFQKGWGVWGVWEVWRE